ncbi:response regulator [Acaryochloris sp. CCMEE 5410]|uniref:response regulator n=1 Tax=Acaryochloris sp. CCMEE 5410 TaxID=310037 RepID=UPI0002484810|nr:response regulator [Acaryochloris sp. CCMEE 5410]KAI9131080.1 response regulator [Acaryochloris sp. CCMEE 5410]
MSHDSEQEVRLQFLEEAFEHCHQIESGLLGIGSNGVDRQQIDGVLRAAHSVKGGAALMGFHNLSHLAHRLEDFFKVLKIGKVQVDGETESLLLTGMDFMRQVATLNQQGDDVDEQWLETQANPVMEQLHDLLGDPQPEDEASLLSSEVGEDMSIVLFESEVEECLTRLEEQVASQDASIIVAEFDSTLEELGGLGEMLDMAAFHGLCMSTMQYLKATNDPEQQLKIAEVGLQELRRSQAMVLVGQKDAIPATLDLSSLGDIASVIPQPADASTDPMPDEADPFAGLDLSLEPLDLGMTDSAESDLFAGADLALESQDLETTAEADLFAGADLALEPQDLEVASVSESDLFAGADLTLEAQDLEAVAPLEAASPEETAVPEPEEEPQLAPTADLDAFANVDLTDIAEEIEALAPDNMALPADGETATPQKEITEEVEWSESFAAEAVDLISSLDSAAPEPPVSAPVEAPKPVERKPARKRTSTRTVAKPMATGAAAPETADTTIRVPVSKLNQLNELFGELIIERNGLQMQLKQLRDLTELLRDRVHNLDKSNAQLRAAYDKISVQEVSAQAAPAMAVPAGVGGQTNGSPALTSYSNPHLDSDFDLLEMDRYSEMHLLSQELMEAAVQIQEVTGDINTSLGDAEQTTRGLTRTSKLIQTSMTQVRMRPVSELLSRFPRVLRDLSLRFGKQVELKVVGGSTLVDRSILESLNDPLIHLIRNSFDHGIEKPEARVAAGKSPKGVIEIRATYRGNQTQITIKDDGGGINLDKIKNRAMEMGLDAEDLRNASTSDLLDLIFEPGFSTASAVTDLSGRGVGMDVVRTNLQKIRGSIAVDTETGVGTTFTISVPFTLSVIRVLLVEVANMMLAFPTDIVEEMMLLNSEDVLDSAGAEVLNWDGEMVPLVRLNQWLKLPRIAKLPDTEQTPSINAPTVLMVEDGNELVGLQVDRYWSEQEVTIRQAEGNIAMPEGFAGCTILGDGRVIPLVDALSLLNWMNDRNNDFTGSSSALADALSGSDDPMVDTASQQALVMVVDDSVNVRRFLALTLEKAGYRVEQAKDGQHALEKLESGLPIQAVVCDIEMPRMDGYGFLAHVKAKPNFKSIPVAMLTSRSGDKHRKLAMTLGASAYFSKPFREKELLQTLEQFTQAK